ncbi:hypothetical protein GW17_00049877, partial [Ensete ventricosum]
VAGCSVTASLVPPVAIVHFLCCSARSCCYLLPQSLSAMPSAAATATTMQLRRCPLLHPLSSHSKGHRPPTPLLQSHNRRSTPSSKPQPLVDSFEASVVDRLLL